MRRHNFAYIDLEVLEHSIVLRTKMNLRVLVIIKARSSSSISLLFLVDVILDFIRGCYIIDALKYYYLLLKFCSVAIIYK